MSFQQRSLSIVDDLSSHPHVHVFANPSFVVIRSKRLPHPGLSRTFEPTFESAGRPDIPFHRCFKLTKSMVQTRTCGGIKRKRAWVNTQGYGFLTSVPEMRENASSTL